MIIVKLIGGLGNQLFQYALGRHLAHINNTELKLDISGFEEYKLHAYSLNHFNIIENIATKKEINSFKKYQRKPGKLWFPYNRLIADENRYFQEKQFHFDPRVLKLAGDVYLDGYWQTEKYFREIKDTLLKEIVVKTPLTGRDLEIANEIEDTNAVMVHIRRGDYVTNSQANIIHGTCGLDYYSEGISIIAKNVANLHIFVFSDDHEWVKNNIKFEYPTTYVDHNKADKNYEDLRLMSLCKHHIIANSSFSWWGAWLSQNPDKIVIGPSEWFRTKKTNVDTNDVIPESWIRI